MGHLIGSQQLRNMRKTGHKVKIQHLRLIKTGNLSEYLNYKQFVNKYPNRKWGESLTSCKDAGKMPVAYTYVTIEGPEGNVFEGINSVKGRQFDRRDSLGRSATEAYFRMCSRYPNHDPFVNMVK